jgi:hypothetical protein
VAIYLCGVLSAVSCGYLIVATTWSATRQGHPPGVRIWGLRAPLGAFIASWGGVTMLVSAPFDDWWHNAYGLDVRIVSPPHMVLVLGILAVEIGATVLILSYMNRTEESSGHAQLDRLFLYLGGMMTVGSLVFVLEYTFRLYMHGAKFFCVVAFTVPWKLAALARASSHRWAATIMAGIYSVVLLGLLWILPLFPAEPKLGPVYRPVTTFIPPEFPLLLVAPALALDLLRPRFANRNAWLHAIVAGVLFMAVFIAVQWPFANFLMSPLARNWFFGAIYFDYNLPDQSLYVRHLFLPSEATAAQFWRGMALAFGGSILSVRVGLSLGRWMQGVKR